jgi:glutamyl-Q tRNA(Asp) synthetase
MASWCDARAHDGLWKLRIEDIDAPRTQSGAADAIVRALERYGFEWDSAIVRQSERTRLYDEAFAALRAADRVYACACSRSDLAGARTGAGGERIYPGNCSDGIAAGRPPRAWRARVKDVTIRFADRAQGAQSQRLALDCGDFVVRRADGPYAYQLAVVVDDTEQQVTDIVRGADLLDSTPRQIWLQRVLHMPTPSYLHHPVAVDENGNKLSKQTGAHALPRQPERALLAAWSFLGQAPPRAALTGVGEFWDWAHGRWNPQRVPAIAQAPAPVLARAV